MYCDWVDVYAGDSFPEVCKDFRWLPIGLGSGGDEVVNCLGDEGAGAACRVQHSLVQWVRHQFLDHCFGEPTGGVILSQLFSFIRRYYRLVHRGCRIRRCVGPVEPGNASSKGFQEWQSVGLGWPC